MRVSVKKALFLLLTYSTYLAYCSSVMITREEEAKDGKRRKSTIREKNSKNNIKKSREDANINEKRPQNERKVEMKKGRIKEKEENPILKCNYICSSSDSAPLCFGMYYR